MKLNRTLQLYVILLLLYACGGKGPQNGNGHDLREGLNGKPAYLNVQVKEGLSPDTIILSYWEYYIRENMGKEEMEAIVSKGSFTFELAMAHPGYFSLAGLPSGDDPGHTLLQHYLICPGDSVHMVISDNDIVFSGRGAVKYQARHEIDKQAGRMRLPGNLRISRPENQEYRMNWFDSVSAVKMKALNEYKDQLHPLSYAILQADIIGGAESSKYYNYVSVSRGLKEGSPIADHMRSLYNNKLKDSWIKPVQEEVARFSKGYTDYIVLKESVDSHNGKMPAHTMPFQLREGYKLFRNGYTGVWRQVLVTHYLVNQYSNTEDQQEQDSCFSDALSYVSDEYLKDMLKKVYDHQRKGARAYSFSLKDTSGNVIRLRNFKGKVVLLDFWFTGCRACTYYAKTLAKVHEAFKGNEELAFVTISIDQDPERWRKSVAGGNYTAPGSVNLYTNGKGNNHPIIKHYDIFGYPRPLLIDREGKIYRSSGLHVDADKLIGIVKEALEEA